MDYPLAEAILGFAGGSRLDMGVVHAHHEYGATITAARRARLRRAARRPARGLRARRRRRRSSTCWARTTRRGCASILGDDVTACASPTLLQTDPARRAVHLLRRRDRAWPAGTTRTAAARSRGTSRAGMAPLHAYRPRPGPACAERNPPSGPSTVVVAAAGGAIAYRAAARRTRVLVVAVNAADEPARLEVGLDGSGRPARASSRSSRPRRTGPMGRSPEVDGSALVLGPRSGSVLRLG